MAQSTGKITLWGVEVFAAIADELSITAAAKRLETSAATVSQQLTRLEAAIGQPLIDRTGRPIRLTPAGEMFLRRANLILNEAEQARAELMATDAGSVSRLRLGMIEDLEADISPALLTQLGAAYDRCQFLLETGPSHRLYDLLDARSLDVIIATDMDAQTGQMVRELLLDDPFVVAVPKGGSAQNIEALMNDLPLVQYTRRHHIGQSISAYLSANDVSAQKRFELDSYNAILAMVADGAGWTILPALGWWRAARFRQNVEVSDLPFGGLSRRVMLSARGVGRGRIPQDIADRARSLFQTMIVDPATAELPFLQGKLRTLK